MRNLPIGTVLALASLPASALASQTDAWRVTVPSPTAASLGKFGDIPVSLYTGVPGITVPLFTARGKTLDLPIALQYHASGIRVEEIGGWVGMGWALIAGGSITRTVRGMVDEWEKGYYNTGYTFYDSQNWPTPTSQMLYNLSNSLVDGEPDDFFFNFAGRSGQFVIGPTTTNPNLRDIRTIPYHNWLIEPTIVGDSIVTWRITTEDGTRYTFGVHETHIDRSPSSVAPFYGHRYASSWFLTEIRAPGGDVISLAYESYNAEHDMGVSQSRREEGSQHCPSGSRNTTNRYQITAQRLASITSAAHTVTFTHTLRSDAVSSGVYQIPAGTAQEPRLDKVIVSTPAGTVLRQFQLVHDYSLGNRLTLTQVFEQDRNNVALPPYTFTYWGPALPPRTSFAVDHWGYYNAAGNTTLIPTAKSPSGIWYYGASRTPQATWMQAGALKRITYPTGGYNEFVYEPNDYTWVGSGAFPLFDSGPQQSVQAISSSTTPGLRTASFTVGGVGPSHVTISVFFSSFPNPCTNCPYAAGPGVGQVYQSMTWVGVLAPGTYQIEATEAGYGITVSIGATWRDYIVVTKKTAGGLRVAEVQTADAMGNVSVRKYKYVPPGYPDTWSSGVIQHEPKYDFAMQGWLQDGGDVIWCAFYERASMTKLPLGGGPIVGYGDVTVWDGPNGEYGKTRHTFVANVNDGMPPGWPYLRRTSNAWKRGLPSDVLLQDAAGRTQRESQATFAYPTPAQTTRTFRGMAFTYWPATTGAIAFAWNAFNIEAAWRYQDSQISTVFDTTGTTSFSTSASYVYGNPVHAQLTEVTETNSDGTQRITRMRYPDDYAAGSANPEAAALTAMRTGGAAHHPGAVVERSVSVRVGASERVMRAEITTFKEFLAGQFLPYQHFVLNSPSPIP